MIRVLAASVALLCLPAMAQEPVCTIGGTVVDSVNNQPVVRARVMASAEYSLVKLTDEYGSFCFESLAAGEYRVRVQKAGYQETEHGVKLAVAENDAIQPLAIRMTRYASITGTVLDPSGEPLPGADVTVWNRVRGKTGWGPEAVSSTNADAFGAFRFAQLTPGSYYLSVNQPDEDEGRFAFPFADSNGEPPIETDVETFYSGSLTFAAATPVELQAGQHVENLVLTLKKALLRRVSGSIVRPPRTGFLTYDGESETGAAVNGAIPIGRDGSFLKLGLPPKRYILSLGDGQRLIAQKEVDLTLGDVGGVTLEPIETMDVPVTIRTEGKGPAFRPRTGSSNFLLVKDGTDEALPLQTADKGSYRFPGVPRGIYRLQLQMAGQALYVKGVTYGGETQTGNKVDLRSVREGGLEVTLSSRVATVQGRATPPSGGPEGDQTEDLTVILVDAASGPDAASIAWQTSTDQKGRFQMRTVPPGKYRLFAIEGFNGDAWGSPDLVKALASKSVELELKENEKKQVSVTIISADEWNQAVKKIGE